MHLQRARALNTHIPLAIEADSYEPGGLLRRWSDANVAIQLS